jgi:hypothetical protein
MTTARRHTAVFRGALPGLGLFAVCALLRLALVDRQGLWADELFSLAMATGHSLEQPAAQADPTRGDYVEAPEAVSPAVYSRYLEHDHPPASLGRVVRAVRLSDTNPPLYYMLLYGWTRALGTGDAVLRLFSAAWALACFPVIWSLARQMGGRAAQVPVGLLFTFSPMCLFYSTEGRMYSLLWFWTVGALWLALRLRRAGPPSGLYALAVTVGAAGLLTHYFFAFVWLAGLGWLLIYPGRLLRWMLGGGAVLTVLLVLPWYTLVPETLSGWRVTAGWLGYPPAGYSFVLKLLLLPWSYFSVRGDWGDLRWVDVFNLAIFAALAAVAVRNRLLRFLFSPRRRLLWLCVLAACLGVVAFDRLKGTYAITRPRYAIAGMPAAFLLAGACLGRLRARTRAAFLTAMFLPCLLGIVQVYQNTARGWGEPFRQLGAHLAKEANASDLVIVHSIPSGVAGVARYMDHYDCAPEVGFASWVGQLKQRHVPDDLRALAAGRRRIILVRIHEVGEPAPEEEWLLRHVRLTNAERWEMAIVLYFRPSDGDLFFPGEGRDEG